MLLKEYYYKFVSGRTSSSMVKVSSRILQLVEEECFILDMNGRTDKDGFVRLLKRKGINQMLGSNL